jgi:hypothetical protein
MPVHLFAAGLDWGSVPDWVAALGTVAAFLVALRLLAKELAARREQEEDRRRAQARLVNAWLAMKWVKSSDPDDELQGWIIVNNASDEPVYQVKLTVVRTDSGFASDPEAARGQAPTIEEDLPLPLLPQEHSERWAPAEWKLGTWHVVLGLSFTDSQGRRWKRVPDGSLTEVTKRPRRSRKDYMNAWIAGEVDQLDY